MRKIQIRKGLCLLASLACILTGCGSADLSGGLGDPSMKQMAGAPGGSANGISSSDVSYDAAGEESRDLAEDRDTSYEETGNTAGSSGDTAGSRKTGETSRKNTRHKIDREKIVYRGNVAIETLTWKKSVKKLDKTIDACGGIVQSRNEYYNDNDWYYGTSSSSHNLSITMRIPAESFQNFMDAVGDVGSVRNKSMNADNITWQYYDTKARLESYQLEKETLESLMAKAEKMSDILEIESKLTDLQYQIESTRSSLENMDLDVTYSTIDITLSEVERYTGEEETLGQRITETLLGSVRFFGNFLKYLILGILYFGPPAIVILLILAGIRKLWRRFHKKKETSGKKHFRFFSKKKKAQETVENLEKPETESDSEESSN